MPGCGGMTLRNKCIHVSNEYELGRKEVSLQRFKYVRYDIYGGQEGKKDTIGYFPSTSLWLHEGLHWKHMTLCSSCPCGSIEGRVF